MDDWNKLMGELCQARIRLKNAMDLLQRLASPGPETRAAMAEDLQVACEGVKGLSDWLWEERRKGVQP